MDYGVHIWRHAESEIYARKVSRPRGSTQDIWEDGARARCLLWQHRGAPNVAAVWRECQLLRQEWVLCTHDGGFLWALRMPGSFAEEGCRPRVESQEWIYGVPVRKGKEQLQDLYDASVVERLN